MKVIDMHCDTITEIYQKVSNGEECRLKENKLHLDLLRMKKSDYLLQNFAVYVNLVECENPLEYALKVIDFLHSQIKLNEDKIRLVKRYKDIEENSKLGLMSALLTIEEGGTTKLDLAHLRNFYRLGVLMLTLTWNFFNGIGHPNFSFQKGEIPNFTTPNTIDGLTDFGIEFVCEMERLGMIIDVSHLSDAGFYDVLEYTKKPFVASHSNARTICNHVRNMSDDMIKKLSDRGGVMGMNFCASFIKDGMSKEEEDNCLSLVVEHIKHIINVGGYECIGLGSDFDGIPTNLGIKDVTYMPILADRLKKEGLSNQEIEAVFYKNVLRLYKDVLS